jgi:hypothetical protein
MDASVTRNCDAPMNAFPTPFDPVPYAGRALRSIEQFRLVSVWRSRPPIS